MRVCGLRPRALLGFYTARVRQHPTQEILAGLGIAVGVALVYAVLVSSASITGSAERIADGIAGRASLQLTARSDRGFPATLAEKAATLPGVRHAAPLLRSNVTLVGPHGREAIHLVGATPQLASLGGDLTHSFGPVGIRLAGGIAVPDDVAGSLGARPGDVLELQADGMSRRVAIATVLTDEVVGPLAGAGAALASMGLAQELTNRSGRLSQLLIEPEPGQRERLGRQLQRLVGSRLNVLPADAELTVVRQAAGPNDQSTRLFAVIGAMVGFLFSLNAMLFTVAERRRFIAALRLEGATPGQVSVILAVEALALGVIASAVGLLLGELLLRTVFGDVPDYLTFAFPVGTERIVQPWVVVIAFCGGVLAVFLASVRSAFDLRPGLEVDAISRDRAEPGEALGRDTVRRLLWLGCGLVFVTALVAATAPLLTVVCGVTLALATLLVTPAALSLLIGRLERLTRSTARLNLVAVALMELRATTTRSLALTAVAALAVYGSVAIGGAREDIVRGLDSHTRQWLSNADIWVTTGGQHLMTNSFASPGSLDDLRRAPGVRAVRFHRGGFLDVDGRRLWLIGRSVADRTMIPPSQMVAGDLALATFRLRQGGWATVSTALANAWGIGVGDYFTLPTPTGSARFRLAATTRNLGWIPGAVTINGLDYAEAIGTDAPSALEIELDPGVAPADGKRVVEQTLGADIGLTVQTRAEREQQYYDFGREGLSRLRQIAGLLLLAAAFAVACALGATLWQRRPRLAALKVQGVRQGQLWRAMLFETGLLIFIGCLIGAAMGIYGHFLADRFLRSTTDFAAPFVIEMEQLAIATSVVTGVALAISAIPGYLAAGVPARASFRE